VRAFGDNAGVTVPEVYWPWCGPDDLHAAVLRQPAGQPRGAAARGWTASCRCAEGEGLLEAAILHGQFHGDAHAGTCGSSTTGGWPTWTFGIMGELAPSWRELLRDMLYTAMLRPGFERVARGCAAAAC